MRNVLATVVGTLLGKSFVFVLKDGNLSMLAQNAVLLYIALDDFSSNEDLVAVWASHGLTLKQSGLLGSALHALANDPWPSWLSASSSLTAAAEASHSLHEDSTEQVMLSKRRDFWLTMAMKERCPCASRRSEIIFL